MPLSYGRHSPPLTRQDVPRQMQSTAPGSAHHRKRRQYQRLSQWWSIAMASTSTVTSSSVQGPGAPRIPVVTQASCVAATPQQSVLKPQLHTHYAIALLPSAPQQWWECTLLHAAAFHAWLPYLDD